MNECIGTGQTGMQASQGRSYCAATTRGCTSQSAVCRPLWGGGWNEDAGKHPRRLHTTYEFAVDAVMWEDCWFWFWVANLQVHDRFRPGHESLRQAKVINARGRQKDRKRWDTHSISTDEHSSISPFALVKAGVVNNPLSGQCKRLETKNKSITLQAKYKKTFLICNLF